MVDGDSNAGGGEVGDMEDGIDEGEYSGGEYGWRGDC